METQENEKPSQKAPTKFKIIGRVIRRPIVAGAYNEFREKLKKSIMPKRYDVLAIFDTVVNGSFQTMYIVDQFDKTGAVLSIHESFMKKDSFIDDHPKLRSDFGNELSSDYIRIR